MYKIVITAGGTSERIDNVRKITNSSSGKLGSVIASKLLEKKGDKIEKIYYVCSKNSIKPTGNKIEVIEIVDTTDLEVAIRKLLIDNKIDYFIHSMAVSDYTVDYVTTAEILAEAINDNNDTLKTIINFDSKLVADKISSNYENLIIKLKKTPKVISIIKSLSPKTYLVGFKLLDKVSEDKLLQVAYDLKEKNSCDLVVANDLNNIRQGEHKAFILKTKEDYVIANDKEDIAEKLIKEMLKDA